MSSFTRACESRRAGRARVPARRSVGSGLLGLLLLLGLLGMVAALLPATSTAAAADVAKTRAEVLRGRTDAQLTRLASLQEAKVTRIGTALLDADRRRSDIEMERDVARDLLGGFLAESYKRGGIDAGVLGDVFTATSLREAADRLRVARIVADHHQGLIRELDQAEAQLEISRVERAQLITELAAAQGVLVDIRAEQERRSIIRAEHAAARAKARAERDAKAAARRAAAAPAATTPAPGALVAATPFALAGGQPSAASIDAYLASKGSPMTGQGAAFMASGQRWRVDPRLLVAIAGAESSFGQNTCGPHNAWGWACPNDPADFATWADGIDTVTEGLRRYYLDEGRTSVSLIQQKYCPVGAANDPTGLNVHWTTNVTKFLLEQGGNPSMVGPGPSGGAALIPNFGGLRIAVD